MIPASRNIPLSVLEKPSLRLILRSKLITLPDGWNLSGELLGTVVDFRGLPITYDYLVTIAGQNFLIYPDDVPIVSRIADHPEILESEAVSFRLINSQGEIKQLELNGTSKLGSFADAPSPNSIPHSIVSDINDARLLDLILQNSGNLVEILEPVSENGVIVDFRWILLNTAAKDAVGDLAGKRLSEYYPIRGNVMRILSHYREVMETGSVGGFEVNLHTKAINKWLQVAVARSGDRIVVTSLDVTHSKTAALLSKRSHEILDSMNDACFALDNDANIIFLNKRFEDLINRDKDSIVGQSLWELFPGLVTTRSYEAIQVNGLNRKQYTQEEYFSEWLGLWISLRVTPTEEGCIVLFHEIHEIMESRKNLEEEHRRLNDAQAIGHVGSFEWDLVSGEVYWSDELFRIHGLEPQSKKITFKDVIAFIHPDDRGTVAEAITHTSFSPAKYNIIHRLMLQDGTERYVERRFESFADESGKMTRMNGTVHDITESKRTEDLLQKHLDFLRQTEELAEIGSWEFDREHNSFYWSKGMYKIFGLEEGTPVEPEIYIKCGIPEDRPVLEKIVKMLRSDSTPFLETIRIKSNEKIKTIRVKGTFHKDEIGRVVRVIGIDLDVTGIIRSERPL